MPLRRSVDDHGSRGGRYRALAALPVATMLEAVSSRPHHAARAQLNRTLREVEALESALRVLVPSVPAGDRLVGDAARMAAIQGTPRRLRAELERLRAALRDQAEAELGPGVGREIYDRDE